MPVYRRDKLPNATFFFTAVAYRRRPIWASAASIDLLHDAVRQVLTRHPLRFDAAAMLPDHVHFIWTLPLDDTDFSTRWRVLKHAFTKQFVAHGGEVAAQSTSRDRKGERGVWQRRFWEHVIRNDEDFERHLDYIHYYPVRHGMVDCPHALPYSSFAEWVKRGRYDASWQCVCDNRRPTLPEFGTSGGFGESEG